MGRIPGIACRYRVRADAEAVDRQTRRAVVQICTDDRVAVVEEVDRAAGRYSRRGIRHQKIRSRASVGHVLVRLSIRVNLIGAVDTIRHRLVRFDHVPAAISTAGFQQNDRC
jgi:hypothetical protein